MPWLFSVSMLETAGACLQGRELYENVPRCIAMRTALNPHVNLRTD